MDKPTASVNDLLAMIGEYEVIMRQLRTRIAVLEQAVTEAAKLAAERSDA